MWQPRLSIFDDTNPYYDSKGQFNIYTGDVRMPNCTSYAYLRMQEEMELTKRNPYLIRGSGGFGNAKTWFNTTPLPKGYELKEGAICVFDGNAGHVAVAEVKKGTNRAIISQSQYDSNKSLRNYKYWETREVDLIVGQSTLSGIGKLIGYIYPPINDIRVKKDNTKHQIEIIEDMVNVRKAPNGEIYCKGLYAPKGIFNVSKELFVDGHKWFELEENHWVREGEWLNNYDVANEEYYKNLYWNLVDENKTLKNKLEEIKKIAEV